MVNEGDYVAIFNSIHRVMKAEKQLKREITRGNSKYNDG